MRIICPLLYHLAFLQLLLVPSGASGRNRTCDAGIFSPSLYQLSYRGIDKASCRVAPRLRFYRVVALWRICLLYLPFAWRVEAANLPSKAMLLHSRRNSPPYNKAHFSIDFVADCSARIVNIGMAVCAFFKMHPSSCRDFHSATSCPESKRSLTEPMRDVCCLHLFTVLGSCKGHDIVAGYLEHMIHSITKSFIEVYCYGDCVFS